jgi:hypothetical protein
MLLPKASDFELTTDKTLWSCQLSNLLNVALVAVERTLIIVPVVVFWTWIYVRFYGSNLWIDEFYRSGNLSKNSLIVLIWVLLYTSVVLDIFRKIIGASSPLKNYVLLRKINLAA